MPSLPVELHALSREARGSYGLPTLPFGLHNVQLSPLLRTGSLLVVPAAVRYLVDPLRAPSASWLESLICTVL